MTVHLGEVLKNWTPPPAPGPEALSGRYARLERLDPAAHATGLYMANSQSDAIWTYLPYGPFPDPAFYRDWVAVMAARQDPFFYAIRDLRTGELGGVASYLRITPEMGTIEVGHVNLSQALQRTVAATEAMVLMMRWAFDAGYRRYEWKCNALNLPSRRAAQRLGLSYEGVFRQAAIIKGHNRDTAWFAAVDKDWQSLSRAYDTWLSPDNFDDRMRQRQRLSDLTAAVRVADDPVLAYSV